MKKRLPTEDELTKIEPILEEIKKLKRKHYNFFHHHNKELMQKLRPLIIELLKTKNTKGEYLLTHNYISLHILGWREATLHHNIIRDSGLKRFDKPRNKKKREDTSFDMEIKDILTKIDITSKKHEKIINGTINQLYKNEVYPLVIKMLKFEKPGVENSNYYSYKDISKLTGFSVSTINKIAKDNNLLRQKKECSIASFDKIRTGVLQDIQKIQVKYENTNNKSYRTEIEPIVVKLLKLKIPITKDISKHYYSYMDISKLTGISINSVQTISFKNKLTRKKER